MEGGNIFDQLGINWQLFLSQAVNFFILLVILRMFVYKPLLLVIKKRQATIEEGLQKAKEADIRLKEVDGIAKTRLQKADQDSIQLMKDTEIRAEVLRESLYQEIQEHHKELIAQVDRAYKKRKEQSDQMVLVQAFDLVKKIVVKTVQLKPEVVDEALIKKAIVQLKDHEI